jgi:hypothetical protein
MVELLLLNLSDLEKVLSNKRFLIIIDIIKVVLKLLKK